MLFQGFERRKIDVGGVGIACATAGSGPPLLLLHGFPQCLAMWAKTAPLLAENFSVVSLKLRYIKQILN
jgi:haloacetate dehalogenase